MTRARFGSWIFGVLLLLLLVSRSMSAIGPAVIVFHGGTLQTPVVIHPPIGSFMFMWGAGTFYDQQGGGSAIPAGIEGRRYLEYDVYWGLFKPEELKPEAASQHGRLYLPTADRPAAVVHSGPHMASDDPSATRAPARPVPSQLKDFPWGRALMSSETAALVAAGVPMN